MRKNHVLRLFDIEGEKIRRDQRGDVKMRSIYTVLNRKLKRVVED